MLPIMAGAGVAGASTSSPKCRLIASTSTCRVSYCPWSFAKACGGTAGSICQLNECTVDWGMKAYPYRDKPHYLERVNIAAPVHLRQHSLLCDCDWGGLKARGWLRMHK